MDPTDRAIRGFYCIKFDTVHMGMTSDIISAWRDQNHGWWCTDDTINTGLDMLLISGAPFISMDK